MLSADLLTQPRLARRGKGRFRAFGASVLFHALALGSALALTLAYRSPFSIPSGSAPGAPTLTLAKMVIVSPPAPPTPKSLPASPLATIAPPFSAEPAKAAEEGVPVFPAPSSKPLPVEKPAVKAITTINAPSQHKQIVKMENHAQPAAAPMPSSYAPGANVLPHPPYPMEAHDRGETGTVVMNVFFDRAGNVALAEVARTSGAADLDRETQSYIRQHWHSATYAGQSVSVPVEYTLQRM